MKKTTALAALAAATALTLVGCASGDPLATGDNDSSSESIIIGSADFTESQLIATIYSQALQAAGVDVTEQLNIGSREVYMLALQDGSIDLLPEYAGSLLKYLNSESTVSTTDDVVAELQTVLPDGVTLLDASAAQVKDILAVAQETADAYGLEKVSDLVPFAGELSLGGPPEWATRVNGVLGLHEVYGLDFKEFVPLDAGGPLTMTALTSGQVQVGDIFSTDPGLTSNNLVALEDDKALFAAENVVPVISSAKLSDLVEETLNSVSAALTTADLIAMNTEAGTGANLADIATAWLEAKGLI